MELKDKHVLITGASAGIGKELARQFHAAGSRVFLVARREAELRQLVSTFNELRPDSADMMVVDLSEEGGAEAPGLRNLMKFINDHRVDILVNNAGRGSFGYFEEITLQDELRMINLNIVATTCLVHAAIPQMKSRKSGAIISVSSIAGFQPLPYMATYAATKAYNYSHSVALRHELSEFGIRVITLCPGPTETEFAGVARVPGQWSGMFRDPVSTVAADTIRALQRNKAVITPGWRSWAMARASSFFPVDFSTMLTARALKSALPFRKRD
jgi:uncharacterized protein